MRMWPVVSPDVFGIDVWPRLKFQAQNPNPKKVQEGKGSVYLARQGPFRSKIPYI